MARGIERRRRVKSTAAALAVNGSVAAMAPSPTSSASTPVNRATSNGDDKAAGAFAATIVPEEKTANGTGTNGSSSSNVNAAASEKETVEAIMADGSPVKVTICVPSDTGTHQQADADNQKAQQQQQQLSTNNKKGKRKAAAAAATSSTPPDARITSDGDKNLSFTWICTECREAECLEEPESPLLVCEGPCARPFHYPCAGLATLPPGDESWFCTDCQQNRHQCAVCSEYGADDEDVYKCDRATCGLYFHENCLSMYENVEMAVVEKAVEVKELDQDGNEVTSTQVVCRPRFKCPAHTCWTCSGGMPPDPNALMSGAEGEGTAEKVGKDDGGAASARGTKKGGKGKKGRKKKRVKSDNAFAEKKEQLFVSHILYCFGCCVVCA